ncbi:SGNH/GDSL hydrolase family protein [Pedobacter caeni]|uniref:Lysophospholipase L1 n=1 Tax=Pedobacter caeni TaxID=288992 RepID=A0A1M4ZC77_9SPHI|nr:SGNH/GDSL hydrolase family protein [Pedobacter caeni]SHF15216.1 Lysophospholipase L1 [Pedobacter caeni]
MRKHFQFSCLVFIILGYACSGAAQSVPQKDQERDRLIAASQAGAMPLFFDIAALNGPEVLPGDFKNGNEFLLRGGLPNFFDKLKHKKSGNIGYLGGSITRAGNMYRVQSAKYIQSMFPGSKLQGINAGVSGTGTDLGACRLYDQLLKYHPDLVFVEFAVNQAFPDGMEGIIRQIIKYDPTIDICILYTIYEGQAKYYAEGKVPPNIAALERIAAHYNLPSIHMGLQAGILEAEGKLLWKAGQVLSQERSQVPGQKHNPTLSPGQLIFSQDGVHPSEAGGSLYAGAIARAMEKMKENDQPKAHVMPAGLIADHWEDATMYAPKEIATFSREWSSVDPNEIDQFRQFSGWFPYVMKADQPGASFTFKFQGEMFGFFDIGGPESGQLIVELDGKKVKLNPGRFPHMGKAVPEGEAEVAVLNRFNSFCNNRYRGQYHIIEVEPGTHEVRLSISPVIPDKRKILGEKQLDDITQHPEKYNRTAAYIGKILLRGKMIR